MRGIYHHNWLVGDAMETEPAKEFEGSEVSHLIVCEEANAKRNQQKRGT